MHTKAGLTRLQFRLAPHTRGESEARASLDALGIASRTGDLLKSVDDVLRKRYLPHDGEVASYATAPGKYAGNESLTFRPKLLQIQENFWGIV